MLKLEADLHIAAKFIEIYCYHIIFPLQLAILGQNMTCSSDFQLGRKSVLKVPVALPHCILLAVHAPRTAHYNGGGLYQKSS